MRRLCCPIPLQRFPMVGRWGPQIIPRRDGIQPLQLPARDLPQQRGAGLASSLRIDTVEDVLGARTSERANHHSVSAWGSCYRNRERASGVTTAHQPRRHEVRTLLACALGQSACRQGHSVRYVRLPGLLSEELVHARADGAICSNSSTIAPAVAPRSLPANCPSSTGTT